MGKNIIYKYPLPIDVMPTAKEFSIKMPLGAEVLMVDSQGNKGFLWARVEIENREEERQFCIYATGEEFDSRARAYIGTVFTATGSRVWHVFETVKTAIFSGSKYPGADRELPGKVKKVDTPKLENLKNLKDPE